MATIPPLTVLATYALMIILLFYKVYFLFLVEQKASEGSEARKR